MGSGKGRSKRLAAVITQVAPPITTGAADAEYERLYQLPGRVRSYKHLLDEGHLLKNKLAAASKNYWLEALDSFRHVPSGFSLRVPNTLPYNRHNEIRENPSYKYGRLTIYADIMRKRTPIGDLVLSVQDDSAGGLEVRVGAIELREYLHDKRLRQRGRTYKHTGRGFGTAVIERVAEVARAGGAQRLSMHAVGGGAYFWVRAGFDLDVREYPRDGFDAVQARQANAQALATEMLHNMRNLEVTDPSMRKTIVLFEERLSQHEPRSLQELIGFVEAREVVHPRVGRVMPLAAAVMEGISWHGVRFL